MFFIILRISCMKDQSNIVENVSSACIFCIHIILWFIIVFIFIIIIVAVFTVVTTASLLLSLV